MRFGWFFHYIPNLNGWNYFSVSLGSLSSIFFIVILTFDFEILDLYFKQLCIRKHSPWTALLSGKHIICAHTHTNPRILDVSWDCDKVLKWFLMMMYQRKDKHNLFVVFFLLSVVKQPAIFANVWSEWNISFSNNASISTIPMV